MSTAQILTLVIAIYAAGLSTLVFMRQHRLDRPRLKVTLSTTAPVYGTQLGERFFRITAVNEGQRPAVVGWLSIELPDKRTLALAAGSGTALPARLAQGDAAHIEASYQDVYSALSRAALPAPVRVRPFCSDSLGKTYYGEPLDIAP